MRALLARGKIVVSVAVAGIGLVGVGLWAFQPWKLFTSSTVHEKLADGAARKGTFRSLAHSTSGQAEVVRAADGSYAGKVRNFSTSDGPAVHVWLTSQAQDAGDAKFKDQGHLDLGALKATDGDEVYAVPAGTDIAQYKSVLVWCDRFSVGFGVAGLGA